MPPISLLTTTQFNDDNATISSVSSQNIINDKPLTKLQQEFLILYGVVHVIIIATGIIMNMSVIILFSTGKDLRQPINNLSFALAVTDLCVNILGTPLLCIY